MNPSRWTDEKLDRIISNLLILGVLISALVVFCGGVVFLTHHGESYPDYRAFHGEPASLKSVSAILKNSLQLQGSGIIQLGLILLIATPVARVIFSVFGFTKEKDYMYVVFTLIVLSVLLYSLFGYSSPA
ncbi:MAG: DUF1634 domain-containing protein [Terriglobales bacterium]